MDHTTARTYIQAKTDQLAAAVRDGDRDAADQVLDQIDRDGHPAAADALEAGLLATSLHTHNQP